MISEIATKKQEETMPLQAIAESNMPPHIRARLEESSKSRKQALSQEAREQITKKANERRDELVALKVQKAIESREKFHEPKALYEARLQYEAEQKLHAKLERAANTRQRELNKKVNKAKEITTQYAVPEVIQYN